jgi:hypothetical protein
MNMRAARNPSPYSPLFKDNSGGHVMAARKRELIKPHSGDNRYVRRTKEGRFSEDQVDVGRSLAADRRSKSKTVAEPGQGDRGDQRPRGR